MQAGDLEMLAGDFDDGGIDEAEIERILESLGHSYVQVFVCFWMYARNLSRTCLELTEAHDDF